VVVRTITVGHIPNIFMLVFEIVHYELNKFICDNFLNDYFLAILIIHDV
jgi:hypothetical protein